MNLQQIEVFLEIVNKGSFTAAGKSLGYTQSRVTQMMRSLEDEFGFNLFIKDHFGSSLTEAGENMLPVIRQMVKDRDHIIEQANEINGIKIGSIQIGTFLSCAINWLPEVLARFREQYPEIEINIVETGWEEIRTGLRDRTLDVGFISNPSSDDLDFIPLCEDPILAILPEGHRLEKYDAIPLKELNKEELILSSIDYDNDITRVIAANRLHPSIKIKSANDYHQIRMVKQGLGIGMLPKMILDCYEGIAMTTRPLNPPQHRIVGIAFAPGAELGPITRAFVKLFNETMKF